MSKKELEVKKQAQLATPIYNDGDFEPKDLLVPMIACCQGTSDAVKQGKAKAGDILETVNKTVLADPKSKVNFIPFKFFKTWVHCEVVNGRPEYRAQEPYTIGKSFPYEDVIEGKSMRHYEVLNFYVLLENELESGAAFPYLLSFRSTNVKKGRPLVNHMARARALNPPQPLCSMVFSLTSVIATKGKDSWFVFDVAPVAATSKEYMAEALKWLESLNSIQHTVDDSGMKDDLRQAEEIPVTPTKMQPSKEARY